MIDRIGDDVAKKAIELENIPLCSDKKGMTLVFDKGNNSEELIVKLDESRHHFVGSRSPYHHKDLCRVSLEQYREVCIKSGEVLPVYEAREEICGAKRRIIVSFNESTFRRQLHRMEQNLEKAREELSSFKRKARGADGRSTMDSIKRQALEITDRESLQPGEVIDIYLDRFIVFYYIMLRLSLTRIGESPVV